MWIMLSDCFLSIVGKDCGPDELMVRARRDGDIEKVFPDAAVIHTPAPADYRFRAVVKVKNVQNALAREVANINYGNFKNSVEDQRLHDAYLKVWTAMMSVQGPQPKSMFDLPAFGMNVDRQAIAPKSFTTKKRRTKKRAKR